MLFSNESTNVKTAMIEKIPMVTPKSESVVLNRFILNAFHANRKLSMINLNTITGYKVCQ